MRLQTEADKLRDHTEKFALVDARVGRIAVDRLLKHQYMVNADYVLGLDASETSHEMYAFREGMFFVGLMDNLRYFFNPDIPVDSLTLGFQRPEVIGVSPEEAPSFKRLELLVPVRCIDTFVDAEGV